MSTLSITGSDAPINLSYAEYPQGSKNACLPVLAASLLFDQAEISNVPDIADVRIILNSFTQMKLHFTFGNNIFAKCHAQAMAVDIGDVFRATRAGFYILAALILKVETWRIGGFGVAGCRIGIRGYTKIFSIFNAFGITIEQTGDELCFKVIRGYQGAVIAVNDSGICATAVALILAAQFKAETTIAGPGRAPELQDLVDYLQLNGIHIQCRDRVWHVSGMPPTLRGAPTTPRPMTGVGLVPCWTTWSRQDATGRSTPWAAPRFLRPQA